MAGKPLYQRVADALAARKRRPGWVSLIARWIAQRSPAPRSRNEVNLTIERPLPPLLANAVAHHHPGNVSVRALLLLVSPALDHGHGDHLHIEELGRVVQAWHVSDEFIAASPRALRVFGQHLPHLVEAAFGVELHEPPLKCSRRDRHRRRGPERRDLGRQRRDGAWRRAADGGAHESPEVIRRPRRELTG